ncbi:hypothetical protein F6U93_00475 [Tamlana haliotis]|uniref:Uncharacterized protein n=1 Tax=Pseudotamlana haliotis TaxID=2614804 RepID=A0A6N6MN41_9FLAO|nr:hypothetical protein [Tamlana haliotis]KAB1071579.1 hypothetical protein F6U93_00475 [Tamlana haliotis]
MNNIILTLLLILGFNTTNAQVTQEYRADQMLILTDYVRGVTGNIITYSNEGSTVIIEIPTVKVANMVNSTYKIIEEAITHNEYKEEFTKSMISGLSETYIDVFETCEFDSIKVRFLKLNKTTVDGVPIKLDRTLSKNVVKLEREDKNRK